MGFVLHCKSLDALNADVVAKYCSLPLYLLQLKSEGLILPQPGWLTYPHDLHSWLPRALRCEAGKIGISQFSGYCVSFNRQGNISC